ncbi:MAG TPA: ATP-binding protein, partial [Bacteroidales bacterium]|nr:ATP-binding protein [Bacteroidales bacterium]
MMRRVPLYIASFLLFLPLTLAGQEPDTLRAVVRSDTATVTRSDTTRSHKERGLPGALPAEAGARPGIPDAEHAQVFGRFVRGAQARGTGSGLGLAIVQAIARRHHA